MMQKFYSFLRYCMCHVTKTSIHLLPVVKGAATDAAGRAEETVPIKLRIASPLLNNCRGSLYANNFPLP